MFYNSNIIYFEPMHPDELKDGIELKVEKDKDESIHLLILAHGADMEPIPFDDSIHMIYGTTTNNFFFTSDLTDNVINKYKEGQNKSTSKLISEILSECIRKYRHKDFLKFTKQELKIIYPTGRDVQNAIQLKASEKFERNCYEAGLLVNRKYNINKFPDPGVRAFTTIHDKKYAGSIIVLRIHKKDKDYEKGTPYNLLDESELHLINNLELKYVSEYVRGMVDMNRQFDIVTIISFLKERYKKIYIYDFACRVNASPDIKRATSLLLGQELRTRQLVRKNSTEYTNQNQIYISYPNGDVYEGEIKNDKKNGKGTLIFANGTYYEGEWKDDKMYGLGKLSYSDGSLYEGQFKDDSFNGNGKLISSNRSTYKGEWKDNKKNGHGEFLSIGDDEKIDYLYKGEWKDDKKNGHGVYYANYDVFDGQWVDDKKNGDGTLTLKNGIKINGQWLNDELVEELLFTPKKQSTNTSDDELDEVLFVPKTVQPVQSQGTNTTITNKITKINYDDVNHNKINKISYDDVNHDFFGFGKKSKTKNRNKKGKRKSIGKSIKKNKKW
jgi:hypothetical protein